MAPFINICNPLNKFYFLSFPNTQQIFKICFKQAKFTSHFVNFKIITKSLSLLKWIKKTSTFGRKHSLTDRRRMPNLLFNAYWSSSALVLQVWLQDYHRYEVNYPGKTSFLKVMKNQDADSDPKPTYLLEYSFIRRGFHKKQLIHCYEISSKSQLDLLPSLFSKDSFPSVTLAICVDLQLPSRVIEEVSSWIQAVRQEMEMAVQQKIGLEDKSNEWLFKRKEELSSHQDIQKITFPPLNVILVGCKYDIFEKYETENRKWLSRALRYLAHTHNCSLVMSSARNNALGGQVRTFVTETMFEQRPKVISQKDHLKPIFVYRGEDTFAQIGVASQGSISGLQVLRRQLGGLFAQQQEKKREGVDPSKYVQSKIQNLIQQRKKEMAKIGRSKKQL